MPVRPCGPVSPITPVEPSGPYRHAARCTRPARSKTWCTLNARIATNAGPTLWPSVADRTHGAGFAARPGVARTGPV